MAFDNEPTRHPVDEWQRIDEKAPVPEDGGGMAASERELLRCPLD